eukprot:CAMPEP_0201593184 /NCGR_PEP_ID=MMETSP0190_2-20130828/190877_1 /ASSEMBLY_ACC=CAM_ASM_000263 /TAXON_ID=37353 /ORGANISM="Rosalina sp." /LENGTH=350 /DNA_ID=CAMNT_0048052297 /DNA_START=1 /DNA_END=1053 /DNA_ORIENTATION=-
MTKFSAAVVVLATIFTTLCIGDICISRSPVGSNDGLFHGTYKPQTDSNDNTYYVKTEFCDTETSLKEYIYLNNGLWYVGITLNGDGYSLRCPTPNVATPDACPEWINGNAGLDPELKVESCTDPGTPTLSCNFILIENSNNYVDGTYNKIGDNLYENPDYNFFFQYYLQGEYYIIETEDVRESCESPYYYLRSDDGGIDNLQHGDSIIAPLIWPSDGSATITCLEDIPSPHKARRVVIVESVADWDGSSIDGYQVVSDETEEDIVENDLNSLKPELSVLFDFDYVYTIFLDSTPSLPWLPAEPSTYCKDEAVDGSVSCRCKIRYHGPPPPPIEDPPGSGEFIHEIRAAQQ